MLIRAVCSQKGFKLVKKRKRAQSELYGTKEVAKILGTPEWRVKNFSEGAAYRLPPAYRVGSGRGSRRLYRWSDIFRLGIANRLVNFGFTPGTVGNAIQEIPESTLAPYRASLEAHEPLTRGQFKSSDTPLLVQSGGENPGAWQVSKASDIQNLLSRTLKHGEEDQRQVPEQIFVLNIAHVCDAVFDRLYAYRTDSLDQNRGQE